jgi:aspartate/methionine/tyrosine aminotransferase
MLKQIVEIAREADAYLICDEVYRPLYHSLPAGMAEPSSIATLYEKGISTSSISKAYGLAGLRLGWIVTPDKSVIEECSKRRDYSTICVSSVNDILATWALSNRHKLLDANKKMCVEQLDILDKFVNASNGALTYVKPQAGTTVFVKVTGCSDTESFCRELANQYKTLAVPGETFGYAGYLRIGYANHRSELIAGLENIKQLLIKSGRLPKEYKGWN